jgi:hypothetical protein
MDLVTFLTLSVAAIIVYCSYYLFNGVPTLKTRQRPPADR